MGNLNTIAHPLSNTTSRTAKNYQVMLYGTQERYMRNLEFLCTYSGLSVKRYSKRCVSFGLPAASNLITKIRNGTNIGFDCMHNAALAGIFGLSYEFVRDFEIEEEVKDGLDLRVYGLLPGCFTPNQTFIDTSERAINKIYHTSTRNKVRKAKNILREQTFLERPNIFAMLKETQL